MFTNERQSLEQGDVFGFQLHTGNKLSNNVFCLGKTLTERGKEIAREIYISVFISVPLACNMHYGISHIIKEALIFIPLASNTRHRATRVMGQHA